MRVRHLFVIGLHTNMGSHEERLGTTSGLYDKFKYRSGSAARLESDDIGSQYVLLNQRGEPPFSANAPINRVGVRSEDAPPPADDGYSHDVGVYYVFHSDAGGQTIYPDVVAAALANLVPAEFHAGIGKVSLVACNIAKETSFGESDRDREGKNFDELMQGYNPYGGSKVSTMFALMHELRKNKISPMICGYDVPVFVAPGYTGPIQHKAGKQWADAQPNEVTGRKLGLSSVKGTKRTIGDRDGYKAKHKVVLRINENGKICFDLAGWSARD